MNSESDINERLAFLEEEIKLLKEKEFKESKKESKESKESKKEKKPRQPSEYNKFVGEYLTKEKKKLGELYNHKMAFSDATKEWQKQKSNN